ncbi:MBL fold metallo-hydrolase [Celeribacter sp. PS-C1]|uniref:MBL fold metallo-hydrolase n=1 Tax=Celeribacter sp. PS-C1 TaxID=2820813 RepID=UPI001C67AC87|nr:MBL fold metallo-hydrolase [Celeribacter sp. PS-C1]MBW6418524.1 MBL fold metallo-hydrolase [Celeribacter sp. PS-C1]
MTHHKKKSRTIDFLHEEVPEYGSPVTVLDGVRRIVARNPSVMTYHGTNTFLVEAAGGDIVIDPGPDIEAHVDAIVSATQGKVSAILVSHGHGDHVGAAKRLQEETGAPIHAASLPPVANTLTPDLPLSDGGRIGDLSVIATPGHTRDHFCFARLDDGLLFSGDHVLTWSSSIVSPTHGDMHDYMRSLELLIARDETHLLPGHGPMKVEPRAYYEGLLNLRQRREDAVLAALLKGPQTLPQLVRRIYPHQTHEKAIWAAGQNLVAHLSKLVAEGRVGEKEHQVWHLLE